MKHSTPVAARRCKLCANIPVALLYTIARGDDAFDLLECAACGFHFIDYLDAPAPSSAPRAPVSDAELAGGLESNQQRLEDNLALLRNHARGRTVLDIGSGGGGFLHRVREEGWHAVGIELDPRYVARGRALGLDISDRPVEHASWDRKTGCFDAVTLWDVIEHLNDPLRVIARAYQLLRPGGVLLMDTPSRDGFLYRLGEVTARLTGGRYTGTMGIQYSPDPFCHKQIFRKVDMRNLLAAPGFGSVDIREKFELSFPAEYYTRHFIRSEPARRVVNPLARLALAALPIRNKMIVVAHKG
jgi:2-polyprenyl-6-hydroxyphenyl methylase/3-demethylubiquinone-9 3-methyltransferase